MLKTILLRPAGLKQVISILLIDQKAKRIVSTAPLTGILPGKWTQTIIMTKQLISVGCDVVQYEKVKSLLLTKVFWRTQLSIGGESHDEVLDHSIELQENNNSS